MALMVWGREILFLLFYLSSWWRQCSAFRFGSSEFSEIIQFGQWIKLKHPPKQIRLKFGPDLPEISDFGPKTRISTESD